MLLRPRQTTFVERSLAALEKHKNTLGVAPTGCHAPGTLLLMYDGTLKPVEDIQVGDTLMGPDSRPRHVQRLYQGTDRMYEIRPLKGKSFTVNKDHILSLVKTVSCTSSDICGDAFTNNIVNISVSAYLEQSATFKREHKLYRTAIDFPQQEAPSVDPYLFGLLLGDKHLMHCPPPIPHHYKVGSRETRGAILEGLIDSDSNPVKSCRAFSTPSKHLADDVTFISRSLGLYPSSTSKTVNGIPYYSLTIADSTHEENVLHTGFTVHEMGLGDYYGFSVDQDHLYVMGDFTVTHNSGKTIMLSGLVGQWAEKNQGAKACVLAHRDELTQQNKAKFLRVNPTLTTSVFDANEKSWQGDTTFAMVQTLSRENNLLHIPALDLLVIDEAHHAAADSYQKIIDAARAKNPDLALYGVTATPNRGDKKGLVDTFSNVADQITLGELIQAGHLVKPVTYVIDVGTQEELSNVKKTANDFDMNAVSAIMNKTLINDAVLHHWKEKASDRPTIIFCSTVSHAKNVASTFQKGGVNTEVIYGELTKEERRERLERYESGESQVVVNVDVLTEGYDYTPTSCVVLLRPNSYQGTMIQMVGRGLRTVDPNQYPSVVKTDCIILDFGTSSLIHGKLEQEVNLEGEGVGEDAPQKSCPECDAAIPAGCRLCPLCGYSFSVPVGSAAAANDSRAELSDFVMTEVDLLSRSSFKWVDLYHDSTAMMATGFAAWAGAFYLYGHWYAVAGARQQHTRLLSVGERTLCIAACDDWLNLNETEGGAEKSRQWLNETATPQQLKYLPATYTYNFSLTRYHASCLIAFNFNKNDIQRIIFTAAKQKEQVA